MKTPSKEKTFQFSFKKGLKQVVPKFINSFMFMNSSVMKTLKYNKGSLVAVNTEQGQLLFRCWPHPSLESSVLMLSSKSFFQDYIKGYAFCEHYNSTLDLCDKLILNCDDPKPFMKTDLFKRLLMLQLDSAYIREDLKINIIYHGHSCHFTIKKIYSTTVDNKGCQKSILDLCADVSSLNIHDDSSIAETSVSENSPFCSTPISKLNTSHSKVFGQKRGLTTQFYCIYSKAKIIIEKPKKVISSSDKIFFHDFGGLTEQIEEIKTFMSSHLNQDSVNKTSSAGILLVGASGTGKSAIVQAISNEYNLPILNLNNFLSDCIGTGYQHQFEKLSHEIIDNSPCILFLDDIDKLSKSGKNDLETTNFLQSVIHDLVASNCETLLVGTTHNIAAVDTYFRKPGAFEKEIYFKIPSVDDRKKILIKILDRRTHNLNSTQICEISEMTHGFTGSDLKRLCDRADIALSEGITTFGDFKEVLKDTKPISMVEYLFDVPKVKWNDIGGMHAVKTAITEMVDWPLKHSEQFKRFGITPSRGILLYGPPGCSKTMIAKALVSESHLNFISIKGPQLFKKYVGESEKAVSNLFKKARSAAPCVLFFDEIDSLTAVRGSTSGSSNVSERVLTQLLVEIDGIDVLQGVSIIAATNRPDMIDPSFLRPGRFDQMIYVPLPDTATRKEIFEVELRNRPHASDINIKYLVERTEGYTGAEIADVCREAAMCAIEEYITSPTSVITMLHFMFALKSVVPRTSKEMINFYENYKKEKLNY